MVDIIKVENLVKKFNEIVAVNDISFNVKEGEIFAFRWLQISIHCHMASMG